MEEGKSEKDFLQLALDTWEKVLEDIEHGKIVLENESELKCYLFHHCIVLMQKRKFDTPHSVFVEESLDEGKKHPKKCDLVLGQTVFVELKYMKSINTKEIDEVKQDILRLENQIRNQMAFAGVFLMIDQTGRYQQQIDPFLKATVPQDHIEWQTLEVPNRKGKLYALKVVMLRS